MKIIMHYSNNPPFRPNDYEERGLGGTESYAVNLARQFTRLGHSIKFYNFSTLDYETIEGVYWSHVSEFNPEEKADMLISFRMREIFKKSLPNIKHKVLILADTESIGLGDMIRNGEIDSVVAVSHWQMDKIAKEEKLEGHPCWILSSNGINISEFELLKYDKHHDNPHCIHLSTPERGLGILLDIWPRIVDDVKEFGIRPELDLYSSFFGWGVTEEQNEDMCRELYNKISELNALGHCIHNFKHVKPSELRKAQLDADFFLYPTNFNETYCISLTECMYAGAIPIVSNHAALRERVMNTETGLIVGDDMNMQHDKDEYIGTVTTALIENCNQHGDASSFINSMRIGCTEYAKQHDYAIVANKLMRELERRI